MGRRLWLIEMLKSSLQPDDEVPLELCEEIWYQKGHVDSEGDMDIIPNRCLLSLVQLCA